MKKMKRIILALVGLLVLVPQVSWATQGEGAAGANVKREIPGALGYVPFKEIQLVRWGENGVSPSNGNLSAGDVVVWDCVSDDGVTIALLSATNSVDAVAGMIVSTTIQSADSTGTTPGIDYGRRNWGWMQVRGFTNKLNVVGGNAVAGASLVASATARNATTAGSNVGQRVMGFAFDASETGAGQKAFLDL